MPKILPNIVTWEATTSTYFLHAEGLNGVALVPGSPEWQSWLAAIMSFSFRGRAGSFTARKETKQRGDYYWYAYKSIEKHLFKKYLGKSEDVTIERLEAIAATFQPALAPVPDDEEC